MINQVVESSRHACAAGAACLFGVSLATIDHVVTIIAGALSGLAALISIYGAVLSWYNKRKQS